jgi:two-component system invasion response regulator UvrY
MSDCPQSWPVIAFGYAKNIKYNGMQFNKGEFQMINVMLVDDHELVRTGLKLIFDDVADINVIAEAGNGDQAIEIARRERPNIIMMDISMPGISGLEATRRITTSFPAIRVIVLTVHAEIPFPTCLLEAGASGYLTKGSDATETINAINTVHRGQQYLTRDIAEKVAFTSLRNRKCSPLERLSDREAEVMMMIIQGIRNKDIAEMLCLSPKTTSTLRYRLHEKLGVCNDVELTRYAIRHGIIKEPVIP